VITAVNGQSVTTNDDLATALLNLKPDAQVSLGVTRGASQLTITVTLGERPVNSQG
jgi:S1-C subfamily serine protease